MHCGVASATYSSFVALSVTLSASIVGVFSTGAAADAGEFCLAKSNNPFAAASAAADASVNNPCDADADASVNNRCDAACSPCA